MTQQYDWDSVLETLRQDLAFHVFGMPLDSPGLLDACEADERTILTDERTASLAALGHALAESASLPILCLETGPSFMNGLMGLVESQSARVPLLVVVNAVEGPRRPFGAFQDLPLEGLVASLGIHSFVVTSVKEFEEQVVSAARSAFDSTQPVVVILRLDTASDLERTVEGKRAWVAHPAGAFDYLREAMTPEDALHMLRSGQVAGHRTAVIVGGGARHTSLDSNMITDFAMSLSADLLVSASGRGLVDENHPCFAGLAGLYSTPRGQRACAEADCVVLLGTAVEETLRERWAPKPGATLLLVNTSPPEVPAHSGVRIDVVTDIEHFVEMAVETGPTRNNATPVLPARNEQSWEGPNGAVWEAISASLSHQGFSTICIENGLHDIWAYDTRFFSLPSPVPMISCAEQSAMGVAICGALGATGSDRTLVICGDSTLRMHLPAVTDAVELGLPITYFILQDGGMGWPALSRRENRVTRFPWNSRLARVLEAIGVSVLTHDELAVLRGTAGPAAVFFDVKLQAPPWDSVT